MLSFVEALRLSTVASPGQRSARAPCFRSLQYSFLEADSRTCLSYVDGSLLCSSCRQRTAERNPVLAEFLPSWGAGTKPGPHPSVLSKRTYDQRQDKVTRVRVSLYPKFASLDAPRDRR